MKWRDTPLCSALGSLDLNRRIVSLGLDGSLCNSSSAHDDSSCGTLDEELSQQYFMRSVAWRVYFGILPLPFAGTSLEHILAPWCHQLFTQRALYATHKQTFHECYPCFANIQEQCDLPEDAPLECEPHDDDTCSAAKRASWSGFGSKLRQSVSSALNARKSSIGKGKSPLERCTKEVVEDIISLDIRRTYLNNDPEVPHYMLFNMLSVWRWLHPVVGYHQGMHEIAGYCLQVLYRASAGAPEDCPPEIAECANAAFREADAFFLFDGIMSTFGLAELFHASSVAANASVVTSQDIPERPAMSTLEHVCEHIAFHLLRDNSSELYHHLANTNMFDQLLVFLPRWVRNLFTRELTVRQVMVVWDGIFAVHYYDEVERQSRRRAVNDSDGKAHSRLFKSDATRRDTDRANRPLVVYAGTPEAAALASQQTVPTVVVPPAFSRTVLGVAVAILLHIEEDLLLLEDDFSLLRRLTLTPILSPMVDALWLMNTAMAIANTRPLGIIPIHRKRDSTGVRQDPEWSRSVAAAAATRLTKEELMLQQRSVALVVERITRRLADVTKIDLSSTATAHEMEVRLSADELSVVRGALRELQCVSDRLSFQ